MLNLVYEFTELSKYIPDGKLDPLTFQTVMDAANAKYYLAKVHMDWHQFLDMYSYLHLFFRMCWLKYHLKWLSTWIGTDSDLAFQMCKQRYECNKWDFDSLLLLLHHTSSLHNGWLFFWSAGIFLLYFLSMMRYERAISRFLSRHTKEFPDPHFFLPHPETMVERKKLRKNSKTPTESKKNINHFNETDLFLPQNKTLSLVHHCRSL